jgi:hypothetical protein
VIHDDAGCHSAGLTGFQFSSTPGSAAKLTITVSIGPIPSGGFDQAYVQWPAVNTTCGAISVPEQNPMPGTSSSAP